jgi:serine/threonine protein kinase
MDTSRLDALVHTLQQSGVSVEIGATIHRGAVSPARPSQTSALPRLAMGVPDADFEIVDVLGKGGMGVVLLARQRSLDRAIAIKRTIAGASDHEARALLDEARATGALEHPNIVPVHALGTDNDGAPLFVMKRIEGASLATLIREKDHAAWPALEQRHGGRIEAYVEILMRIADALHFAHESGFVHRDVKPANVMVGAFGEVYLLDWGVAVRKGAEETPGEVVGTPAYIAPEMLDGEADARTDVYLLGGTLHTILTGAPRHAGNAMLEVLAAAYDSKPFVYPSDVPAELAEIANRACHRDRSARFPSALAFRDALGAFLRHRGSMRLVDRASELLEGKHDARSLAEARFALGQALREWSENSEARALLRRTLVAVVEHEIELSRPAGAREALAELDPPDAALGKRVEELEAEHARAAKLADRARADEHERDPTIGGRTRVIVTVTMVAGMLALGTALTLFGRADVSFSAAIIGDFVSLVGVLAAITLLRRRLLANRFGRQLAGVLVLTSLGMTLSHVSDAILGTRLVTDAQGLVAIGTGMAVAAVTLSPRLGIIAASSWIAALVCAIWTPWSGPAALVNLLIAAVVLVSVSYERLAKPKS